MSFENVLVSISKCFYIAQDDKTVKTITLKSNKLSNSRFLCLVYFGDCVSEENLYEAEEKEISNILY
ncbi:MAG TPA: hypothetical protein VJS91_01115 [Nitrososphaeraceae archaeon]|nr:hypothetical protein [Nitrososphaeraceae archaeon]